MYDVGQLSFIEKIFQGIFGTKVIVLILKLPLSICFYLMNTNRIQ